MGRKQKMPFFTILLLLLGKILIRLQLQIHIFEARGDRKDFFTINLKIFIFARLLFKVKNVNVLIFFFAYLKVCGL